MAANDDEAFLKRLLVTFKIEAEDHLQTMSSLLLEIEKSPPQLLSPLVETLFREAHSLKGASRSVNFGHIESICQVLESILADLKKNRVTKLPSIFFDVLHRTVDYLRYLLLNISQNEILPNPAEMVAIIHQLEILQNELAATPSIFINPLLKETETIPEPPVSTTEKLAPPSDMNTSDTIRISTAKLGNLLIQAEELLAFKFSAIHMVNEIKDIHNIITLWKKEWVKISGDMRMMQKSSEKHSFSNSRKKVVGINHVMGDIERDELFVKTLRSRLTQMERIAEQERRALTGMVDTLLEDMKQTLMLPFSSLLELFPKMVRDISRENGKEVELIMEGTSIEIDRRVLEQIKTPLIHLLRNAIDHGIETPADRKLKHKPRKGRISINVTPKEGNKIELVIADDGAGIDPDTVAATALKTGILTPELIAGLSKQEKINLIFESGISTSQILTDMSGRGLGLAIVREKVEKLGGTIFVRLPEAGGVSFDITLPTSLATFRGLLVSVGDRQFVLPSSSVDYVARIPKKLVKTVENRETINLNNQVISLVLLADSLELTTGKVATPTEADYLSVVVLANSTRQIAFVVDEILSDQEVLVKNLGPQLIRVRNISGATVLGAGRVVPILNVADLFKSALKIRTVMPAIIKEQMPSEQRASLLVAEDSITSRTLLKNILESAGYKVTTAVDGIDAFTALRVGKFDLVISDVEMPRMDGFDLTEKIRSDKNFSRLPVVLVTALGSREHKERGIDVGANAYIVKSSFDQSNLLDVIRRLL